MSQATSLLPAVLAAGVWGAAAVGWLLMELHDWWCRDRTERRGNQTPEITPANAPVYLVLPLLRSIPGVRRLMPPQRWWETAGLRD